MPLLEKLQAAFFIQGNPSEDETESIMEWIGERFKPEQIFTEDQLIKWAARNGYEITHKQKL